MPTASPDLIARMPHWVQVLLVVMGALGSLTVPASILASILNHYIRLGKARGEKQSTLLLAVAAGINVPAFNVDKSVEAVKAMKVPEPSAAAQAGDQG